MMAQCDLFCTPKIDAMILRKESIAEILANKSHSLGGILSLHIKKRHPNMVAFFIVEVNKTNFRRNHYIVISTLHLLNLPSICIESKQSHVRNDRNKV